MSPPLKTSLYFLKKMLCLMVAIGLLFTGTSALKAGLYNPKTFTLDNGLQVVVIENHRAPVVTHMLWYKVGSIDDPVGKSGLAHFLEHMMFKGPKGSPSEVLTRKIEALGGVSNAATSTHYTYYYETVASRYLEEVMRLEAARMKDLVVLKKDALTELQVVMEERRMRTDNEPFGRFIEFFNAQFFQNHPKRLPTIGWAHEIETLTASDAKAFHTKWYSPRNAILFLAGDITVSDAKRLARKYYASLPSRPVPQRQHLQEPPRPAASISLKLEVPSVQVPYLIKAYPAPSVLSEKKKHAFSSEVLEHMLSDFPIGYLNQELVEKEKVATFASIYYPSETLGPTYLLIAAQPTPGTSLDVLETKIAEALKKFYATFLTEENLQKTKQRLLAGLINAKDHALGGKEIIEGLMIGRSLEDLDAWDKKISAITLNQVQDLYKAIFTASYQVTGAILPTPPSSLENSPPSTPQEARPTPVNVPSADVQARSS